MKRAGFLFSIILLAVSAPAQTEKPISERNFLLLDYPGFPDAHSSWSSIGYSTRQNKVFIGVTNHRDRIGLYEYAVATKKLRLLGFVADLGHLRDYEWQGKIHSYITEGPEGGMYFSTDGGEIRQGSLMDYPSGYLGGYFMKWDPVSEQLTNLGKALTVDSIKNSSVDPVSGLIYGVTYPQAHFIVYDPRTNAIKDLGRVTGGYVPRVIFTDQWGNGYYVDWRLRLVKFEREAGKLVFARESLPIFEGTPGYYVMPGLTARISDPSGTIYLLTYGSKLIAFHPTREGIGPFEDLGPIYDGTQPLWTYWCRSLARGRNGKIYYFMGGHGHYTEHGDVVVLMEYDPKTRVKRDLIHLPFTHMLEAPGCGVTDEEGNIYFDIRRDDPKGVSVDASGASVPSLMIFNPEKELR